MLVKIRKFFRTDNKGNTLGVVLIGIFILSILGTLILGVTATNFNMKLNEKNSQTVFYNAEKAIDAIYAGIGKEVMDKGYLDKYMGVRLIPLDNAIVPGTLNSSAKLLLADDRIYLLPLGHERPIKVLYEGDSIEVTRDALHSTDKTYAVNVTYRIGVAAVVGNKFGVITLE